MTPPDDDKSSGAISFIGSSAEATPESTPKSAAEPSEPSGPKAARKRRPPLAPYLLYLPTILILGYLLMPIAQRFESAIRYDLPMDAEEGFLYQQALDLHEGRSIYAPITAEPYLVGNYPPLYPWVISLGIGRLGPAWDGLPLGRLVIAFFCILLTQSLILTAYWRARRLLPTILAPLLFLISFEFHQWSAFCRVDLPALALTITGLCVYLMSRKGWGIACAALIFVLAAYTRQTSIFAPAACCLSMLLFDRRRLAWFLVPYLGVGLGGFLIFNLATDGEFYKHLVLYNRNVMDWDALRRIMENEIWFFYRWWIGAIGVAIIFGVAGTLAGRSGEKNTEDQKNAKKIDDNQIHGAHERGVTTFYFIFAALGLVLYAKVGSAPNYGLEPLAAAAIFGTERIGILFNGSASASSRRRTISTFGIVLVGSLLLLHSIRLFPVQLEHRVPQSRFFQTLAIGIDQRNVAPAMFSSANPDASDLQLGHALLKVIRETDGEVFCERPTFARLAGKMVYMQPFIMSQLAREGTWDQSVFLKDIERQRFAAILTTQDLRVVRQGKHLLRYTPEAAETILDHYRLEIKAGPATLRVPYFIWKPIPINTGELDRFALRENEVEKADDSV